MTMFLSERNIDGPSELSPVGRPSSKPRRPGPFRRNPAHWWGTALTRALPLVTALIAGACGTSLATSSDPSSAYDNGGTQHASDHDETGHGKLERSVRVAAQLATAVFQDVGEAERAGYASTLDALGCFQDPERGGMGVHFLNNDLMDANLDVAHPEALVYELDANGNIVGLVAHEYIVPTAAWTKTEPPRLAGIALHRRPTLPLWVLHTWLWKDNPAGVLNDWNPAVRLCPSGVPIFGVDRPLAEPATTIAPPTSSP